MNSELKCQKCGQLLTPNALTCENCGSVASAFDNREDSSGSKARILVFVLLLTVVGFVVISYIQSKSKDLPATKVNIPTAGTDVADEIESLEQMLRNHPDHTVIALRLGNLYASQNNHRKAAEYYRIFVSSDSYMDGQEIMLNLAKSLFIIGKVDEAKEELNLILKMDPNHDGALYNLGAIEANLGNSQIAEQIWRRLLEHHSKGEMVELARKGLDRIREEDE